MTGQIYKPVADPHSKILDAPSPGYNFLHFHAILAKFDKIIGGCPLWVGDPYLGNPGSPAVN